MRSEDELVPAAVATMLGGYRALLAERGSDWGDELEPTHLKPLSDVLAMCSYETLLDIGGTLAATPPADLAKGVARLQPNWVPAHVMNVVLAALPDPLPPGIAIATPTGANLGYPLPFALAGRPMTYQVISLGKVGAPARVSHAVVGAEQPNLQVGEHRVRAVDPVPSGQLRLVADAASRWTVVDERGGAWFPDGILHKYDYHGRPFFHGNDLALEVPVGRISVEVTRGCEFRPETACVVVTADEETVVALSPSRMYDAAARGWYGGDTHVHMNYSGDLVATPHDASRMQEGEALHVMNLVAANWLTALVYEREALEQFAGRDLPWSTADRVARWGVEYRNDLLGHFTAFGPSNPPGLYQTGHPRSQQPQDWPSNAAAAAELRALGATVTYTHPVMKPLGAGNSSEPIFTGRVHDCQARELVADAALGFVDSVDLTGYHTAIPGGSESTEYLYHRLLGCGIHLAATAGTDSMLSHSRAHAMSNPPGWSRAYANLGGQPLSVDVWREAVRAGRTFSTNGPWLELNVNGGEPGDTLDDPRRVSINARAVGLGMQTLEIVGPDGVVATTNVAADMENVELTCTLEVTEPIWLAAIVRGGNHPVVLGPSTYAHTSPVWIRVAGESVARAKDADWCLDWLRRFEAMLRREGNFPEPGQLDDLIAVIGRARSFYRSITGAE